MPAKTLPRVQYNLKSILASGMFVLNLLVLPFEVYLYEVIPFHRSKFRVAPAFAALASCANYTHIDHTLFESLYNDSSITTPYANDATNRVDVVRSQLPRHDERCPSERALVQHIQGSMYFPGDFQADLVTATCSSLTTTRAAAPARRWNITLFGSISMSTSIAWLNADSTLFYLYIPSYGTPTLLQVKLACRVLMGVYMLFLVATRYYCHVKHLADALKRYDMHVTSTAVRFDILVGEPTSLVVANPFVCAFFIVDIWASAEYVGLACLRVSQLSTWYKFMLGLLSFGRMMWFSAAGLLLLNVWLCCSTFKLRKFQPVDVMYLTMASFTMGPVAVYVQGLIPAAVEMYTYMFGALATTDPTTGAVATIDCTFSLAIFSITMCIVPVAFGYSTVCATSAARVTVQRVRRASSSLTSSGPHHRIVVEGPHHYEESRFNFNDYKQRLSLWFCHDGRVTDGVCYGGSAYRLFNLYSTAQVNRTINQRGTDCYVFGYNSSNALVEITRVSLVSHINLPPLARVVPHNNAVEHSTDHSTTCAVGRIVFSGRRDIGGRPSIILRRGVDGSPWVA